MTVNWRQVSLFLALAYGISWALALGYFALGGKMMSAWALPVFILYMFGPTAAALIMQWLAREAVAGPLQVYFRSFNRWWIVAWLAPLVLAFAAMGASLLLPHVSFDVQMPGMLEPLRERLTPEQFAQAQQQLKAIPPVVFLLILAAQGLLYGPTVNAVAAFGEELGWRGWLWRALAPLGFWRANLLIGLAWGLWHAPLIWHGYNYPQHPRLGVAVMTLFTIAFAPLIGYARLRGRSVIPAAIMHGTLNAVAGLSLAPLAGATDLTRGLLGLPGIAVLVLASLALLVFDRGLSREAMVDTPETVP